MRRGPEQPSYPLPGMHHQWPSQSHWGCSPQQPPCSAPAAPWAAPGPLSAWHRPGCAPQAPLCHLQGPAGLSGWPSHTSWGPQVPLGLQHRRRVELPPKGNIPTSYGPQIEHRKRPGESCQRPFTRSPQLRQTTRHSPSSSMSVSHSSGSCASDSSRSRSRSPRGRVRQSDSRSRSPSGRVRQSDSRSRSPSGRVRQSPSRSRSPSGRVRQSPSRSRSPSGRVRQSPSRSRSPSGRVRQLHSWSCSSSRRVRQTRSRGRSPSRRVRQSRSRGRSPSRRVRQSRSRGRSPSRRVRQSRSRSCSPSGRMREFSSRNHTPSGRLRKSRSGGRSPSERLRISSSRGRSPRGRVRQPHSGGRCSSRRARQSRSRSSSSSGWVRQSWTSGRCPSGRVKQSPSTSRSHHWRVRKSSCTSGSPYMTARRSSSRSGSPHSRIRCSDSIRQFRSISHSPHSKNGQYSTGSTSQSGWSRRSVSRSYSPRGGARRYSSRSQSPHGSASPSRTRSQCSSSSSQKRARHNRVASPVSSGSKHAASCKLSGPSSKVSKSTAVLNQNYFCVKVMNLPLEAPDKFILGKIKNRFKSFGNVISMKLHRAEDCRFVVVVFKSQAEQTKALGANGDCLFGQPLLVTLYERSQSQYLTLSSKDNKTQASVPHANKKRLSGSHHVLNTSPSRLISAEKDEFPRQSSEEINDSEPQPSRMLFISNLDSDITKQDLLDKFGRFGEIVDIYINSLPGAARQFAFLQFACISSAALSLKAMNGAFLGKCQVALSFGTIQPTRCVFVEGLSSFLTNEYLIQRFSEHGTVEKVLYSRQRGSALILYVDEVSARKAVKVTRSLKITGDTIVMDYANDSFQLHFCQSILGDG